MESEEKYGEGGGKRGAGRKTRERGERFKSQAARFDRKVLPRYRKIYSLVVHRKKISPFVLRALKRFERDGRGRRTSCRSIRARTKACPEAWSSRPTCRKILYLREHKFAFFTPIGSCLKFDRNVKWIYVYVDRNTRTWELKDVETYVRRRTYIENV